MVWKIVGCFFLFASNLFSGPYDFEFFSFEGELHSKNKPLFISLGSGCDTGITLRECGLRDAAFPFDWLIFKNHKGFIKCLEENFKHFTDKNYLVLMDGVENHPYPFFNNYYKIIFMHEEGPEDSDASLSEIEKFEKKLERTTAKYERRIERFRQLDTYNGKVFFIRNFVWDEENQREYHNEQALELKNTLNNFFPTLDFTLVVVTYTDTNVPPLEKMEGVIEFQMYRPDWGQLYKAMYLKLLNLNLN